MPIRRSLAGVLAIATLFVVLDAGSRVFAAQGPAVCVPKVEDFRRGVYWGQGAFSSTARLSSPVVCALPATFCGGTRGPRRFGRDSSRLGRWPLAH